MSKFIPILFSTSMVQAILEGRKTMTRRVIKPQPIRHNDVIKMPIPLDEYSKKIEEYSKKGFKRIGTEGSISGMLLPEFKYKIGDILWVREKFRVNQMPTGFPYHFYTDDDYTDKDNEKWKPSLFMPKAACRIFLEITNVRVERLAEISPIDAIKEGIEVEGTNPWYKDYVRNLKFFPFANPWFSFRSLWILINGKDSWTLNPWVWVIEFKRVEKPEGFI